MLEISKTDRLKYIKSQYLAGKTCTDIAKELGCTFPTILYHLKRQGVAIRNRREASKITVAKRRDYFGSNNPCFGRRRPEEEKQRISEATKKAMTPKICAHISEAMLNLRRRGPLSPAWKGGVWRLNWYPYEFDLIKYIARDRDGHICQICHVEPISREHDVHHLDGDTFNNELENLITLCRSCHKNIEYGNF